MRSGPRNGLSLAEVLLALALAALAALSLMVVLIGGLRLLERSQEVSEATAVGRELMERIKAQDYAYRPVNVTFDGRVPNPPVSGFPPAPYPSVRQKFVYTTRVQVQTLDAYSNRVSVEVFWENGRSLTLETVMNR